MLTTPSHMLIILKQPGGLQNSAKKTYSQTSSSPQNGPSSTPSPSPVSVSTSPATTPELAAGTPISVPAWLSPPTLFQVVKWMHSGKTGPRPPRPQAHGIGLQTPTNELCSSKPKAEARIISSSSPTPPFGGCARTTIPLATTRAGATTSNPGTTMPTPSTSLALLCKPRITGA